MYMYIISALFCSEWPYQLRKIKETIPPVPHLLFVQTRMYVLQQRTHTLKINKHVTPFHTNKLTEK